MLLASSGCALSVPTTPPLASGDAGQIWMHWTQMPQDSTENAAKFWGGELHDGGKQVVKE